MSGCKALELKSKTKRLILAAVYQNLPIPYQILKLINRTYTKCRFFINADEAFDHLTHGHSILALNEFKYRHDTVRK